mgnify:CR=1 FL=1
MTVSEFLDRVSHTRFVVSFYREADGSIFLECDHGFRDAAWSRIRGPIADDELLDDVVARTVCLDLRIPPGDIGL